MGNCNQPYYAAWPLVNGLICPWFAITPILSLVFWEIAVTPFYYGHLQFHQQQWPNTYSIWHSLQ